MNKKYIKPMVKFESLNMSTDVASGCASGPTFEEFACPVMVPEWGETVFGELNCDWSTPKMYDMLCYHVPTADHNVFSS